jgi:hypothetical protein
MLKRAEFFLPGMKAQSDKRSVRIMLGDNTSGGAVMLRPIGVQCVGVWISSGPGCSVLGFGFHLDRCVQTHLFDRMYTQIRPGLKLTESTASIGGCLISMNRHQYHSASPTYYYSV